MKKDKGFIGIGLILAIIAVLVAGGGAYYLGTKNSSESKNVEGNISVALNDTTPITTKNYTNTIAGYSVNYPINWIVNKDTNLPVETRLPSDRKGAPPMFNSFEIANIKGAVKSGSDFSMETNGSIIDIQVTHGIKYSTIDELYKDGAKYGIPANGIQERLAKVINMNIGGQNLRVESNIYTPNQNTKPIPGQNYTFIYDRKSYSISYTSGSDAQYNTDLKVFTDLLASFKLLTTQQVSTDNEESSTEIFNNQPGSVKVLTPELGIRWVMAVDLLTLNLNFIPGENDFFINQNPKIRNLIATYNTKTYKCGADQKPSVLQNTGDFINDMQKNIISNGQATVYFDINGTSITAMYQQCLP